MDKTNETRSPLTATGDAVTQERSAPTFVLFTPKEAATRLKVSQSFLAKARMRGDGPPYILFRGRSHPMDAVAAAVVDQRVIRAPSNRGGDIQKKTRSLWNC